MRYYNKTKGKKQLKNLRNHFEVLNNLLEALIKDPKINKDNKLFCERLLNEFKIREKTVNKSEY